MMSVRNILVAAILLALPMPAFAQSADVTYCKALAAKYREFNKQGDPSGAAAAAMSECDTKTAGSISTLEQALKDQKVPLPPRS
jgi:hypothetical protein